MFVRAVGRARQSGPTELSGVKQLQLAFWHGFSEHLAANSRLKGTKPLPQHWMNHAVGRGDFALATICSTWSEESTQDGELRVDLLIDGSEADAHFRLLQERQEEIEASLDETVTWHRRENTRQRKVYVRRGANVTDESNWPECFGWLQERLETFDSVFRPLVASLDAADAPPEEPEVDDTPVVSEAQP